jgi:hypothetical protein
MAVKYHEPYFNKPRTKTTTARMVLLKPKDSSLSMTHYPILPKPNAENHETCIQEITEQGHDYSMQVPCDQLIIKKQTHETSMIP